MAKNSFFIDNKAGLRLFFQLWGWLIGPLIIFLFLGRWLDEKYGTNPWLFFLCVGLAFGATIFGILMETLRFLKSIRQEDGGAGKETRSSKKNGDESKFNK